MPKIISNGIELYYQKHAVGQPLVLISGLGYSLWQWHKMVPFLAEHFQVIAFDNRGVGRSDKPEGRIRLRCWRQTPLACSMRSTLKRRSSWVIRWAASSLRLSRSIFHRKSRNSFCVRPTSAGRTMFRSRKRR